MIAIRTIGVDPQLLKCITTVCSHANVSNVKTNYAENFSSCPVNSVSAKPTLSLECSFLCTNNSSSYHTCFGIVSLNNKMEIELLALHQ